MISIIFGLGGKTSSLLVPKEIFNSSFLTMSDILCFYVNVPKRLAETTLRPPAKLTTLTNQLYN